MTVLRMGAGDVYAESVARQAVTAGGTTTWADVLSTSFSPAVGDYLVLAHSMTDNYATTTSAYGKFVWDGTAETNTEPAMAGHADITAGQKNLVPLNKQRVYSEATGGVSRTVAWQGRSNQNTFEVGYAQNRLLILKLADFEAAHVARQASFSAELSTATPFEALSITPTVSANPHLLIGSWYFNNVTTSSRVVTSVLADSGDAASAVARNYSANNDRGQAASFAGLRSYAAGSRKIALNINTSPEGEYVALLASSAFIALDLGSAGGQTLTAATGAIILSGKAAATRVTRKLPIAVRSFTLAGINAAIRKGYRVRADVRGYGLAGFSARVARGLKLRVSAQAFTMTGIAAGLIRTVAGRTISAATGALTLTRQPAGLRIGRKLRAAPEPFVWSRLAAGLRWTRQLAASGASFSLSGRQIGWGWVHILRGAPAAYSLNGQAATLRYSGGQGWQPVPGTPETWNPKASKSETWTPVGDTPEIWS
ncbi:hypothetical protein [Phenylobacterium sp. NIBR 498073]|uniref:hypothetical protein n=1 Tax=Phenylobacterium sp. NIBR 498073 TaxID=3015177 RepID=UPI0022B5B4F3|nr:hypothetical protein [Phenylobacterium sp. NIBR 498073]WGU39088.1 hypothetical protein O4N75_15725 [Phenylobacterium sp. NIBR 498073]